MSSLALAIWESSDYSSDTGACIKFIRTDIETFLKPIIRAIETSHPLEADALKQLHASNDFASSLMSAIWPQGNQGAIPDVLKGALEPIAAALEAKGSEQADADATAEQILAIRSLYAS